MAEIWSLGWRLAEDSDTEWLGIMGFLTVLYQNPLIVIRAGDSYWPLHCTFNVFVSLWAVRCDNISTYGFHFHIIIRALTQSANLEYVWNFENFFNLHHDLEKDMKHLEDYSMFLEFLNPAKSPVLCYPNVCPSQDVYKSGRDL